MPVDFSVLGVAGVVAALLAYGMGKLWSAYLAKDAKLIDCQETHIATYTTLLVNLTGTLDGLKRVIEDLPRESHDVLHR